MFLRSNELEQFEFQSEKIIGMQENVFYFIFEIFLSLSILAKILMNYKIWMRLQKKAKSNCEMLLTWPLNLEAFLHLSIPLFNALLLWCVIFLEALKNIYVRRGNLRFRRLIIECFNYRVFMFANIAKIWFCQSIQIS